MTASSSVEGAGFRYIAFVQYSSKSFEEALGKNMNVVQAERKKYPGRYPKKFLEDHWLMWLPERMLR